MKRFVQMNEKSGFQGFFMTRFFEYQYLGQRCPSPKVFQGAAYIQAYHFISRIVLDHFTTLAVLKWPVAVIKSYLTNRKQKVKLCNSFSDAFNPYGVLQGFVLGSLLFTLYTTSLGNIISSFNVTTISMLMTPKYIYYLTIGTLIPVLLSV